MAGKAIYGGINVDLASLWIAWGHGAKVVDESLHGEFVGVWGDGGYYYGDWFFDDLVGRAVDHRFQMTDVRLKILFVVAARKGRVAYNSYRPIIIL